MNLFQRHFGHGVTMERHTMAIFFGHAAQSCKALLCISREACAPNLASLDHSADKALEILRLWAMSHDRMIKVRTKRFDDLDRTPGPLSYRSQHAAEVIATDATRATAGDEHSTGLEQIHRA